MSEAVFEIENGVLLKFNGTQADVVVPEGVSVIGSSAFAFCDKIVSIRLPETVTEIRKNAFMYCKSLKELYIPDSVTTICSLRELEKCGSSRNNASCFLSAFL